MALRVLIVADVPGWAFDNIARNMKLQLSDTFTFEIAYMADYVSKPWAFLERFFFEDSFDIVHFFWREDLRIMLWHEHLAHAAATRQLPLGALLDAMTRPLITMSIYDHLLLSKPDISERREIFAFCHGYTVSSAKLDAIYRKLESIPPPSAVIADGVSVDLFSTSTPRVTTPSQPLKVGWVGNPRWGEHSFKDAKGLSTILKPALEIVQSQGFKIESHFADVQQRRRTRDEMVEYYREIDVLVCSSLVEGTPNPVLEAMASGAAVISTDVGIVPDVLGPKQQAFILSERSVKAMAQALAKLASDRQLTAALGEENTQSIKAWDWSVTTQGWQGFWETAQSGQLDEAFEARRRDWLLSILKNSSFTSSSQEDLVADAIPRKPPMRRRMRIAIAQWVHHNPVLTRFIKKLRGRKP